jgi:hypothetical protein
MLQDATVGQSLGKVGSAQTTTDWTHPYRSYHLLLQRLSINPPPPKLPPPGPKNPQLPDTVCEEVGLEKAAVAAGLRKT